MFQNDGRNIEDVLEIVRPAEFFNSYRGRSKKINKNAKRNGNG